MATNAPAEPTLPADEQTLPGHQSRPSDTEPSPDTRGEQRSRQDRDDDHTDQDGEDDVEVEDAGEVNSGAVEVEGQPPLPDEEAPPPLPDEPVPGTAAEDDGWDAIWDDNIQAYYFYNRITQVSQWENPRVPDAAQPGPPGVIDDGKVAEFSADQAAASLQPRTRPAGGYDPAIHGDYDPTAWYAQQPDAGPPAAAAAGAGGDPNILYTATGTFNRFTGKWQAANLNPEKFNDENKSHRQLNAFFDVDAAANSHEGRSLKAERSGKKLTKKELKAFREKRREKKEEKRRAWLRD